MVGEGRLLACDAVLIELFMRRLTRVI